MICLNDLDILHRFHKEMRQKLVWILFLISHGIRLLICKCINWLNYMFWGGIKKQKIYLILLVLGGKGHIFQYISMDHGNAWLIQHHSCGLWKHVYVPRKLGKINKLKKTNNEFIWRFTTTTSSRSNILVPCLRLLTKFPFVNTSFISQ